MLYVRAKFEPFKIYGRLQSGMATGSGRPLLYIIVAYSFGMMIHHYRFNSFVYSMTQYDLDRNLQGH